jgi:peptidoglycan hydrolase-like protein with peptidoglycan-binding domain
MGMYMQFLRRLFGVVAAVVLFLGAGSVQAASLSGEQAQAILGLLASFGADQGIIANVAAALGGQGASPKGACVDLSHTLSSGSTDALAGGEVSRLQAYLGVRETGYFGPLTKQAVIDWQKAHAISAIGVVGPATRGVMACSSTQSPMNVASTVPETSTTPETHTPTPVATVTPTTPSRAATMYITPTSGRAPLQVSFLYDAPYLVTAHYFINFGDGLSGNLSYGYLCNGPADCSMGWNIRHTYVSAGVYTATITTSNEAGATTCASETSPGCSLVRRVIITVAS